MAIARKAFVWGLFAAGGTLAAMLFPVLILVFALVSAGLVPVGLEYQQLKSTLGQWPVALVLLGVLVCAAWHAAHRLRIVMHDLGLRSDKPVATAAYLLAGLYSVLTAGAFYLLL
jgi:fumarate reductase subunit D